MSEWENPGSEVYARGYSAGRASFERELAASGKVVVDRELVEVAQLMASSFVEEGHPGRPCLRTGWRAIEGVRKWQEVVSKAGRDAAAFLAQDSAVTELAGETQEWGMT